MDRYACSEILGYREACYEVRTPHLIPEKRMANQPKLGRNPSSTMFQFTQLNPAALPALVPHSHHPPFYSAARPQARPRASIESHTKPQPWESGRGRKKGRLGSTIDHPQGRQVFERAFHSVPQSRHVSISRSDQIGQPQSRFGRFPERA